MPVVDIAPDTILLNPVALPNLAFELIAFAGDMVEIVIGEQKRGGLIAAEKREFIEAGFDESRLLGVVAAAAASTTTNCTFNITRPPLETTFQPQA